MLRRQFLAHSAALRLLAASGIRVQDVRWNARWIFPAGAAPNAYGVYHFRRTIDLPSKPQKFIVHVSGDSRYHLYVNGVKVSTGPARGDLYHWRFETVDLAPHLNAGENVLAAVVWNDGIHAALAQWSNRTGFLLQADETEQEFVNTGKAWKSKRDAAYQPTPLPGNLWNEISPGYYAISPMEQVDAASYPWGWQTATFDDAAWEAAEEGPNGSPRDESDAPSRWMLVPRPIPAMEETPIRLKRTAKAEGTQPPPEFPAKHAAFTVPANSKTVLLLDQGHLTTGFPELEVNGGAGAVVTLRYAEALFEQLKPRAVKGNRNEVGTKTFRGYGDRYTADGGRRLYRPLFWRTWRYMQVTIETKNEPLTIDDLRGVYTGYPFTVKAKFDSGVPQHAQILETGWRTARLCAHETFMDCPYYEQLQYAGDTRIQALVSIFMTGDSRMMRNAIEQINSSRTAEGATYSRAPSVQQQYIPPFCLWWIGMVHDYWWYVDDPDFVRQMLTGVRAVLGFYGRYQKEDGLLGPMPWWNYVDWVADWKGGTPPAEPQIMPATIQFQYLLALRWAAELEEALGVRVYATRWREMAAEQSNRLRKAFWSDERKMYSEDLAHQQFSQHANVLAVLAGAAGSGDQLREFMARIETDKKIYQCTVYFRYYLDRAMVKAGLGNRYLERLGTWQYMLNEGLTTWAEVDSPYTRSDCHGWGASPNIEFFRTVLGVDSAAPGFSKVVVRPHLGNLTKLSGVVPHPKGLIEVVAEKTGATISLTVKAPPGVEVIKQT